MSRQKEDRQRKILEIIVNEEVSTQEELVNRLKDEGWSVTQATISRDIKELNIVKASTSSGKSKFVAMREVRDASSERLFKVFSEAVVKSDVTGPLIVIHTLPGMAPACGSAIDSMMLADVLGSISGDDCLFVACREDADAKLVEKNIMQFAMIGGAFSARENKDQ